MKAITKISFVFVLFLVESVLLSQTRSLDFYLQEGIKNSPLLTDLKNQLRSSAVDSLLIRAARLPQIEARSQALYAPYYHNFGYDEVITDGGNYQAIAAVSQNIFNRRVIENKFKSLAIEKQSINNTSRLSLADLKKTITDQYITSYSDFSDLNFNRSLLELMKSQDELVNQFAKNGVCSQSDYLSLIVETQGQEVLVDQLTTQYIKDLQLLNQLCGLIDTTTFDLQEPHLEVTAINDTPNSPFFIQFVIDSMRLANQRNSIGLNYRPKISWFADVGALSSKPQTIYQHFGYSIGASLVMPIYDGKQKNLELKKLDISGSTLTNYRSAFKKKYDQMLFQLSEELKGTEKIKNQLGKQIETARLLGLSLKAQLEAGQVKMTDYINSIKNFRNINRNLNFINIRILQIKNEMTYLLVQ